MTLGSLATFGYASTEVNAAQSIEFAFDVNPKALLIDTRLVPWCRWDPQWQRPALEARYGKCYLWKGDLLGNLHHDAPDLPMTLVDERKGIAWVITWLEKGATLILLCGCASYARCHRKLIYEQVKARLGTRLPTYEMGERVMTPYGAGQIHREAPLDLQRARNRYSVLLDVSTERGPRLRFCFPHEVAPFPRQHALLSQFEQGEERI